MINVHIVAAVGRGGKNLPDDVKKIQQLLNEHVFPPLAPLKATGVCDPLTIKALEEFQRRVMHMAKPSGLVKPQDDTMDALSPVNLRRSPETLVPYRRGHGLQVHHSGDKGLYGTPKTLASIESLAWKVAQQLGATVTVNDISLEHGGEYKPHASHRRGVDVDIRPLRKDKKSLPTNYKDDSYSRELTEKMVGLIKQDANLLFIIFNDMKIEGLMRDTGKNKHIHDNHLHIRFRD